MDKTNRRKFLSESVILTSAAAIGLFSTDVSAARKSGELADSVNVMDFMTEAQIADVRAGTASMDVTSAWAKAQNAANLIRVPSGTYLLNDFRFKTNKVFVGEGYQSSIIKQKSANKPAINCLSDASSGQLWGVGLRQVQVVGAPGAKVAAVLVAAYGAFAVFRSEFDFAAGNTFRALEIQAADANNVFECKFKVSSQTTSGTAVLTNGGVYNEFDFFLTNCASYALQDTSWDSFFTKVISDGVQVYSGQNNLINKAVVEAIHADKAPVEAAINVLGFNNTLVRTGITTVANAKCGTGYYFNATTSTVVGMRIIGKYPESCPKITAVFSHGSSGTFIDCISDAPVRVDTNNAGSVLRDWEFVGQCSTITNSQVPRGGLAYSYQTPSSGATILVEDNVDALILHPSSTSIAKLKIIMPQSPKDKQVVRVSSVAAITALTVSANTRQQIVAVPTSLLAGGSFAMIYNSHKSCWFPSA